VEQESASRTDTSTPYTAHKRKKDENAEEDVAATPRSPNAKRVCLHPQVAKKKISKSSRARRILAELRKPLGSGSRRIPPRRRGAAATAERGSGTRTGEENVWTFTRIPCAIL
jgi:hypothetical protein